MTKDELRAIADQQEGRVALNSVLQAIDDETEACAALVESHRYYPEGEGRGSDELADAIRKRKELGS